MHAKFDSAVVEYLRHTDSHERALTAMLVCYRATDNALTREREREREREWTPMQYGPPGIKEAHPPFINFIHAGRARGDSVTCLPGTVSGLTLCSPFAYPHPAQDQTAESAAGLRAARLTLSSSISTILK
jgi:hypothetical protein